ncbi:MAG: hypothetical protein JST93_10100 [Acidobacteria bacterium]|nr:hypothetical protein [Acidobacteriota bacterium]
MITTGRLSPSRDIRFAVPFRLLLLLASLPAFPVDENFTANIRLEPPACGCYLIRSPEEARYVGGDLHYRRDRAGRLLIGRSYTAPEPGYFFRLLPSPPFRATTVDREVWEQATPIPPTGISLFKNIPPDELAKVSSVSFRNREYRRRGEHWPVFMHAAVLSPDEALLFVQSYSGAYTTKRDRVGGKAFTVIYETSTGAELCTITATHQGRDGSMFLTNTLWVGKRELVANTDPILNRTSVYCNFGEAKR